MSQTSGIKTDHCQNTQNTITLGDGTIFYPNAAMASTLGSLKSNSNDSVTPLH